MQTNNKAPVDVFKSLTDAIESSLALAWKVVIALGGLVLVAYCYFESIMPEGLSLGDAFFLASASFSFACIALIGVGCGAFAALWLLKLIVVVRNHRLAARGLPPASRLHRFVDSGSMMLMSFFVALPFAYLLIFVRDQTPDGRMHATLMFFATVGAFASIIFLIVPAQAQRRDVRFTVSICAMAVFGALVATRPALLNLAMVNLGVRSAPGQMLLFSNAEHDELAAIADASGVKVSFCKLPGTAMWGTRAVRAVWYGVGNSSYVRLFDEANASRDVLVRVDRTAMEVLRGDKTDFKCISAPSPTGRASDARPS